MTGEVRSMDALETVRQGLSRPQKELPPRFFYDQRGSELFEEITRLPEYYPTRTERTLLTEWMPRWVGALRPLALVELGAGSASKTRIVLDALLDASGRGCYLPVDISADFLEETAAQLREEYPSLQVVPLVADIGQPLPLPAELPGPALFAFLGSTIGNLTDDGAVSLLRGIRSVMRPEDRFLLGADLRKDPAVLEAAYNDSRGITAEFNLNMLRVLNAQFGADFDPEGFAHRAFYDTELHRIEMHLVSRRPQTVTVPGAGAFRFEEGETIRTEISCKYDRPTLERILAAAGLRIEAWTTDPEKLYSLTLAHA